ncbi:MAG: dicarboxylate/amino acid:cation symporter, partial [Gammaproteobacteria bacterium]
MGLTAKVLLGMVLGIFVGLAINLGGFYVENSITSVYFVDGLFHVVGKLFINALKMLVVPLVFFSVICGVCGIGDIKLLGRIGTKAFLLYMLTTAIAVASAIAIAASAKIGASMHAETDAEFSAREAPPLTDVIINIIPSNPIAAMANGEMLSIIFFAVLTGVSFLMVGKKVTPLI